MLKGCSILQLVTRAENENDNDWRGVVLYSVHLTHTN